MDRRERLLGIAEKIPKRMVESAQPAPRRKVVALAAQRLHKRR
jgi:hypothetical protein